MLYPSLPPISTCSSCGSGGCSFSECSYGLFLWVQLGPVTPVLLFLQVEVVLLGAVVTGAMGDA